MPEGPQDPEAQARSVWDAFERLVSSEATAPAPDPSQSTYWEEMLAKLAYATETRSALIAELAARFKKNPASPLVEQLGILRHYLRSSELVFHDKIARIDDERATRVAARKAFGTGGGAASVAAVIAAFEAGSAKGELVAVAVLFAASGAMFFASGLRDDGDGRKLARHLGDHARALALLRENLIYSSDKPE